MRTQKTCSSKSRDRYAAVWRIRLDAAVYGWAVWLAKSRVADYYRQKDRDRHVFSDLVLDQLADVLVECHSETALRQWL